MDSGLQIIVNVLPGMLQYVPMTLVYTLAPSIIAAILAVFICQARLRGTGVVYWLVSLFVSFFRGTPQLVQLFLILYGLPRLLLIIGIDINDWSAGTFYIIATTLNLSCFVAEAYRGGYLAMDYRQIEAGYSIGFSRLQCFFHVIVPGTLQNAVLNLKNLSIDVLKGASLACTTSVTGRRETMTLDYEFMGQDIPVLLRALPATITLTLWSMLVALLFAVACGAFILVRIPVLKQLVIVINTFIKGVPLVIQLLFCYYAVPIVAKGLDGFLGYHFDPRNPPYFPAAVLALGLNFGAYITDVVVSSVRAIDHGQIEAGKACGMRRREIIWHILLPQVVVVSIPDMGNYFIWLLKGTSVASLVGVAELLGTAKISASQNYDFLEAYLVAALLYWVVCVVAEWLLNLLYARLGKFNIKEDDAMQQFSFFFLSKQAKSKLRRKVSVIA